MKYILYILALISLENSLKASDLIVQITKEIPYVDVIDSDTNIRIERIQDTENKLTDDFIKTSRLCPPHCIAPISPSPKIKNREELELLQFMQNQVANNKGYIVDAREPQYFAVETIPTAINIPFGMIESADDAKLKKLFQVLGATIKPDKTLDYTNAKELVLFCSGPWCLASPKLLSKISEHGYPYEKLSYYRSGLQGWKLLGLTTTVRVINEK